MDAMTAFAEWEDMTKFEELEDGTIVVRVGAGTPGTSSGKFTPAKNDGEIVFNVKFIAKADATGDIDVWAPHANVKGEYIDGDSGEILEYVANAGSVVIKEAAPEVVPSDDEVSVPATDDQNTPETGDATAMIFFAIIALVAIAGSAVVIKTRK